MTRQCANECWYSEGGLNCSYEGDGRSFTCFAKQGKGKRQGQGIGLKMAAQNSKMESDVN